MENSNYLSQLEPLQVNPVVWSKVIQSDEVEQRKIVMLLNRIQIKNGSIDHLIKYLILV